MKSSNRVICTTLLLLALAGVPLLAQEPASGAAEVTGPVAAEAEADDVVAPGEIDPGMEEAGPGPEADGGEGDPQSEEGTAGASALDRLVEDGGWLLLLLVFAFGLLGGLVSELMTLRGRIEWPHPTDPDEVADDLPGAVAAYLYDLGVFARLIVGGAAALLVLWTLEPVETVAVVASAILAGAAGGAVFQALKGRLDAALAQKSLVQSRALVGRADAKLEEVEEAHQTLKEKLMRESDSPAGARTFNFPSAVELPELGRLDGLIGEARALSRAAAVGTFVSTRTQVRQVLADWAGLPVDKVRPPSRKIVDLYILNSDNEKVDDLDLACLIESLKDRFPRSGLQLNPADLKLGGGVSTIDQLVGHLEFRVPRGLR